jgi:hypothetical protein
VPPSGVTPTVLLIMMTFAFGYDFPFFSMISFYLSNPSTKRPTKTLVERLGRTFRIQSQQKQEQ